MSPAGSQSHHYQSPVLDLCTVHNSFDADYYCNSGYNRSLPSAFACPDTSKFLSPSLPIKTQIVHPCLFCRFEQEKKSGWESAMKFLDTVPYPCCSVCNSHRFFIALKTETMGFCGASSLERFQRVPMTIENTEAGLFPNPIVVLVDSDTVFFRIRNSIADSHPLFFSCSNRHAVHLETGRPFYSVVAFQLAFYESLPVQRVSYHV